MAILQRYEGQDGIEILINTESGESFCSVRGYARMAGKDHSTISKRLASANAKQGGASCGQKTAEILTSSGLQSGALVNEDLIAEWLPKDNPTAATALLKLGVRVVLHSMAGFEVKSTVNHQVSADQFQSLKHEFETFIPWATEYPIAANLFLERQGINPVVLKSSQSIEPQSLPSLETQEALNGAFLNLNRSGLMMNKLFKFLDRIPTMKALDEDFVNDLVEGLQASEAALEKTKAALAREKADNRSVRLENQSLIQELRESQIECRDLREAAANANRSKGSAIVLR